MLSHAYDVEAQVVQLAGDGGADVAEPDHDDVPAGRPRRRRTEPVSRAPTTMAVITGMKAMPSTVSSTCAVFSAPLLAGFVSADPVRSISIRYSVLPRE